MVVFHAKPVVAVEREGDIPVHADAMLDRLGFLLAVEDRFPGMDMLRLMKIAASDEGELLQADGVEDIVPVGHFPGIEERRVFIHMFPEIKRVLAPFTFQFVRMRRDGEPALGVNLGNGFLDIKGRVDRLLQVNTKKMSGSLCGIAVLVELDAGHKHEIVFGPRTFLFAFNFLKIGLDLTGRNDQAGEIDQFPEEPLGIAKMVGDAEAIKAPLTIKIDDLRHGEFAVGPSRMGMQIAEEKFLGQEPELAPLVVGQGGRPDFRRGQRVQLGNRHGHCLSLVENEAGEFDRTVRAAQRFQVGAPERKETALVAERTFQPVDDFARLFREDTRIGFAQQGEVPLFLTGAQLLHDYRTSGGNRFLHHASLRAADDDVMFPQQLRHPARMSDHFHPGRGGGGFFPGHLFDGGVLPDANGNIPIEVFQQAIEQLRRLLARAIDDTKDAGATSPGHIRQGVGRFTHRLGLRLHRKAEDLHLFLRHACGDEDRGHGLTGNGEIISRSPRPGRLRHQSIRNQRDQGEIARAAISINFTDQKAVDGARCDDNIGLDTAQRIAKGVAHAGQSIRLPFLVRGRTQQVVEPLPEFGCMMSRCPEGILQQVMETPVAGIEQIQNLNPSLFPGKLLKGITKVPRGDIFPLTETGREDENVFQLSMRLGLPLPL